MIWQNLKHNKCPKCSESLDVHKNLSKEMINCPHCDFRISQGKFLDIRTDMVTKALE